MVWQNCKYLLIRDTNLLFSSAKSNFSFLIMAYSEGLKNSPYLILSILFRSSPPEMFLGKGVLKICSKFTGEHPRLSMISIKLLCNLLKVAFQHYWNHTSAWTFPCKLAAYFQDNFLWKHLWRAASVLFQAVTMHAPWKLQDSKLYIQMIPLSVIKCFCLQLVAPSHFFRGGRWR